MAIAETQVYMPQAPRPRLRLLEDERWLAFVLLVPTLVLLGMFIAYPFVRGILLSVTNSRVGVPGEFVGLANFYKIFNDGIFRTSVYNTFVYTGVTTVFKLALGLWLAMLLNRNFRGKAFTRAFILLPFIIPTVLSTFAWKWMFDPTFSVLNWLLYHFADVNCVSVLERQQLRPAVIDRQHRRGKRTLQRGVLVEIGNDDFRVGVAFELDDDARVFVRLIADVADVGQHFSFTNCAIRSTSVARFTP